MLKKFVYLFSTVFIGLLINSGVFALDDVPGGADHPELPRISGTSLVVHFNSEYGEHEFLVDYDKDGNTQSGKKSEISNKEGKLTRLVYALQPGQTSLFALRNYQEAFAEIGDVKEVYTCKEKECPRGIGSKFVWSRDKSIESNVSAIDHMYRVSSYNKGPMYWTAEIQSDTSSYTVAFFSATINNLKRKGKEEGFELGQTIVHIDIIETASFKSDLIVVEASEIQSAIADKGHIALYGLFFDTGDDQLTTESEPALIEVSKALKAEPGLNLYVVGHTDSVGSLESNQKLSERRASSIVKSLTAQFGIDKARLVPIGVGLAAPVSTNNTEEGRSLNRRVELVERASNQ